MRLVVVLVALSLATACAQPASSDAADPQPESTNSLLAAQTALPDPTISLAEALVQTQRRLDEIRHEVPRGEPTKIALASFTAQIGELRGRAALADTVVNKLDEDDPLVRQAARVVRDLLKLAETVAVAAEREATAYTRLTDLDLAMDRIVAGWDGPGSQNQRRADLAALAAEADDLAAEADDQTPAPEACSALRDHRVRWAQLLAERSTMLAQTATSTGGAAYDELRDRFRPQPYGQDRLTADAADRACWSEHSPVAPATTQARAAIEQLRDLLVGQPAR